LEYIHWEQQDAFVFQIVSFLKRANLKKENREHQTNITAVDGVDTSNVIWKDNETIILLSILAGKMPVHHVEQYDKNSKKRVTVDY
jgi:hypothetical protein